ncbi:hypothetical protein V494_01762 [Pseudogymnoascus sp. VKM F-4513 (FW-928)]|nr:hypothetical protein V494_01762 [Pseudogymnoascus sp. VKM F-4513 (FW-928)]
MSITRPGSTALGWTSIGLGETMEGALMFIIYGDPMSSEKPIVSIRKSTGHKQPTLVTKEDMNGADLRVISADWIASQSLPGSAVAMVSLVCYSCHLWPGTEISVTSKSQPWIWAWSSKQEIPVYTYDAHLKMHVHHAGAGGWGNFYVDMPRSVNNWGHAPSFPPLRPGIKTLGASDKRGISLGYIMTSLVKNPVLHLHGIIMGTAFLLLFPIGVLALRYGGSFKYHWIVQLVASAFMGIGFALGLMLGKKINTAHQVVGILLLSCLGIQGILGWRHHMVFIRIRRRTWLSHSHLWLGRVMIVGGWSNLFSGMILRGYSSFGIFAMSLLVGFEAIGLTGWLWWIRIKAARVERSGAPVILKESDTMGTKKGEADYFALGDDEYDDDGNSVDLQEDEDKPMIP